jgi:hypothetical protein
MRKFITLALLFGTFSLAAFAQENEAAPKAEFFGGYQYTRFDGGVNANGWDTTLTGNLNRWFGIAADFSGAYKTQNGMSFQGNRRGHISLHPYRRPGTYAGNSASARTSGSQGLLTAAGARDWAAAQREDYAG